MNCTDCQNILETQGMSGNLPLPVSVHVRDCQECESFAKEMQLQHGLHALAIIPPMSADFEARLALTIAKSSTEDQVTEPKRAGKSWPSYIAVAAVFMLFGILLQPILSGQTTSDEKEFQSLTRVKVMPMQQETVDILLDSAKDYAQAELSIALTGAVRFDAEGSIQAVSWNTSLKQGKNILPLPVYLLNESGGKITINMKAETGFKQVTIDIDAIQSLQVQETFL